MLSRMQRLFSLTVLLLVGFLPAACGKPVFRPPENFVRVAGERYILDLQYNSDDNFLHRNVYGPYGVDACWLHPDAAAMLDAAACSLADKHLKIVLLDCFRPQAVQGAMWSILPDERYVADPVKGSNHTRGVAVDVTLALDNGTRLLMPSEFDDFSARAGIDYVCPAEAQASCDNREMLGSVMTQAGFVRFPSEWWHFTPPNPERYPLVK